VLVKVGGRGREVHTTKQVEDVLAVRYLNNLPRKIRTKPGEGQTKGQQREICQKHKVNARGEMIEPKWIPQQACLSISLSSVRSTVWGQGLCGQARELMEGADGIRYCEVPGERVVPLCVQDSLMTFQAGVGRQTRAQ
jgi:hypothetical protein